MPLRVSVRVQRGGMRLCYCKTAVVAQFLMDALKVVSAARSPNSGSMLFEHRMFEGGFLDIGHHG